MDESAPRSVGPLTVLLEPGVAVEQLGGSAVLGGKGASLAELDLVGDAGSVPA